MSDESDKTQTKEGQLLDHRYDGIQEFDNPMPRWWVLTFWASFVFSLGYLFHYSVGNGISVASSYDEDISAANAIAAKEALKQAVSEESLAKTLADAASVEGGRAIFSGKCAACHADKGQGLIGPNLTDSSWIHGKGTLMDIYKTVSGGSTAKGMPAWEKQLSPSELRQVVSFVGSIRRTSVAGKAPEGNIVE